MGKDSDHHGDTTNRLLQQHIYLFQTMEYRETAGPQVSRQHYQRANDKNRPSNDTNSYILEMCCREFHNIQQQQQPQQPPKQNK